MTRAHARNAVLEQKFWFRRNILNNDTAEVVEMTVNEIINGSKTHDFPVRRLSSRLTSLFGLTISLL